MRPFKCTLAALLLVVCLAPEAAAGNAVCRAGGNDYESLDAAAAAVMSGEAQGEITLLADCSLSVGEIRAPLAIDGAGRRVTVGAQTKTESGALNINAPLSFKNTALSFENPKSWSAVISSQGALKLSKGSACEFRSCGIYASPGAYVLLDASELRLEDMEYTCMMGESYAALELTNGSLLRISKPIGINGITGFNITCDASTLEVLDCARQGLVKCSLLLKNGASANISSNGYGYNMYTGNVLSVGEGCSLRMNSNSTGAILMQGRSSAVIKSGGSFECRYNGGGWTADKTDEAYGSKAAINVGWFSPQYIYKTGSFSAEDGADAVISDNLVRAVSNYGTVKLGSGSVLTRNGRLGDGETADSRRIERGGGLYNAGTAVLNQGAAVYNNHASGAADDIYNAAGAAVTLPATGRFWMLSDCGDEISGWFWDRTGKRWSAHGGELYAEQLAPGGYLEQLELKAAHGLGGPPQTGDAHGALALAATAGLSGLGLTAAVRRLRRRRS